MNNTTATDQDIRDTLRTMIADWNKMTPAQQEVTAAAAAAKAAKVESRLPMRYASGRSAVKVAMAR